ncbi:FAD-dependent thymidylate synthase [Marininema halotolerans]|uniref:Thymidylate synthase complementing protein n=1 Tax=Marininema halotolerans TaxID=1155944 RepID=A0A1I6RKY7_9BACL|nr:FAD-dependent thymidylate synthase [Marininema halotolerans]SFS65260.1 Thymidylate synthase complementing protein [Marininema halotolerans]
MTTLNNHSPDLTRYVSNLDQDVYAIFNLPEEVIAVIFAYVSRSSASFRDNLAQLMQDDELGVTASAGGMATKYSEKAARFHEKWVVGYGHSSVAEHATAHLGVENISRLASAELELANTFNSFTEYSQRYQRPKRGQFFTPLELKNHPSAKESYLTLQEKAYDTYEALLDGLIPYLTTTLPQEEGENERRFRSRVEKIAFEDARYVLTLATSTSLGMSGNGRALRDTIVRLLSSSHQESQNLARQLEKEISQVIPTLLKHVRPNDYLLESRTALRKKMIVPANHHLRGHAHEGPIAQFVQLPDYDQALTLLCQQILISEHRLSYEEATTLANTWNRTDKEHWMEEAFSRLRFFDNPMDIFKHLSYHFECSISEANWHQLLRHNRGTHFTFGEPTINLGYTIPPHIREAGLTQHFQSFMTKAEEVALGLEKECPEAAPYCITNAHHRQVTATASLWELYHLINLRTSPEAQWDIQQLFEQLAQELTINHPALVRHAKRRL